MKALIISASTLICVALIAFFFFRDWIKAAFYIDHMEREERISRMHIDRIIECLQIQPGIKIADIGAGSGLFSRKFAKHAGANGAVYAIDINGNMLNHIDKVNKREGIANIQTVIAREDDPKIPEPVDLIYICDTLHYIKDPDKYCIAMSRYLKSGGRIAVVDFKQNWPPLSIVFTGEELTAWMESAGVKSVESYDFIEDEYLMIFKKSDSIN